MNNGRCSIKRILVAVFALMWSATAQAQNAVPVTVDNFVRAESDRYFARFLQENGDQLGKFHHERDIASVDNQPVIRNNRDVLLSSAVLDLDAGAATITLPDPGKRFMSIL
ncbi:MAG: DUF1254 domain-containing protein, partial [Alphaproteobacteria bacterium]|nr:DUF1254 domain-containing protein [Alphaproteobacteria bacterium]